MVYTKEKLQLNNIWSSLMYSAPKIAEAIFFFFEQTPAIN